jgi:hypothetical protein
MRRHRLHFSSIPSCRSFAINCPHSHRASVLPKDRFDLTLTGISASDVGCCINDDFQLKLRTIINISEERKMSRKSFDGGEARVPPWRRSMMQFEHRASIIVI